MANDTKFVNEESLKQIVLKLESEQEFTTRSALYNKIAEVYNAQYPEKTVSTATIMNRIEQFEIPLKTQVAKKGRQPNPNLDKELLVQVIEDLENENEFEKRGDLYQAVETYFHEKFDVKLSAASVYNYVNKYEITPKTPLGRRGKLPGSTLSDEHKQKLHAGRKNKKMAQDADFQAMYDKAPERYHPLVDKVAKGNKRAAIKLHCLDCVAYSPKEVRSCTGRSCAFFAIRPYQGNALLPVIEEETEELTEAA